MESSVNESSVRHYIGGLLNGWRHRPNYNVNGFLTFYKLSREIPLLRDTSLAGLYDLLTGKVYLLKLINIA